MLKRTLILMLVMWPLTIQAADAAKEDSLFDKQKGVYFVDINPVIVPIIDSSGKSKAMMVNVTAEISEEDDVEAVRYNIPKIRDVFIRVLYKGVQEKTILDENGQLDIAAIKEDLINASNYVFDEKKVTDILLNDISVR